MQDILVVGGGGHGKVVIDIVEKENRYRVAGLLDSRLRPGERVLGYEVVGSDAEVELAYRRSGVAGLVVAVGDNWARSRAVESIKRCLPDVVLVNCVHPSAQLARSVSLGVGNVIMAGCVINSGARVGDCCILNTNCSVDHDCVIGDFASFGPSACAGGNVEVGPFTAVCLGANIIHKRSVGSHTVVGAGSTVVKDLPSHVVAYGTPAKPIRARAAGDEYL